MRTSRSRTFLEYDFRVAAFLIAFGVPFVRVIELPDGRKVFQFRNCDEVAHTQADSEEFWQRVQSAQKYLRNKIESLKRKKRLAERE